jgi:uncharacterized protein YjdB
VSSLLVVGPTSIATGQTSELTASASTIGGKQVVTSGVTWQSSKPGVATVSDAGILTAVAPGTVTVTATYQGVTGSLTVTVADVTVSAITFYGTTTVTRGGTTQLTATAVLGDGSMRIVTNFAAWASLNTDIATVSAGGLVTTLSRWNRHHHGDVLGPSGRGLLSTGQVVGLVGSRAGPRRA